MLFHSRNFNSTLVKTVTIKEFGSNLSTVPVKQQSLLFPSSSSKIIIYTLQRGTCTNIKVYPVLKCIPAGLLPDRKLIPTSGLFIFIAFCLFEPNTKGDNDCVFVCLARISIEWIGEYFKTDIIKETLTKERFFYSSWRKLKLEQARLSELNPLFI